jgi:uncharacterized protein YajQ (UPF0234 family)
MVDNRAFPIVHRKNIMAGQAIKKQLYRIVIQFDGKYAYVAATNMFIGAASQEIAEKAAVDIFRGHLVKHGIPNATYKVTTTLSSESEAAEYEANLKSGQTTHRTLN